MDTRSNLPPVGIRSLRSETDKTGPASASAIAERVSRNMIAGERLVEPSDTARILPEERSNSPAVWAASWLPGKRFVRVFAVRHRLRPEGHAADSQICHA